MIGKVDTYPILPQQHDLSIWQPSSHRRQLTGKRKTRFNQGMVRPSQAFHHLENWAGCVWRDENFAKDLLPGYNLSSVPVKHVSNDLIWNWSLQPWVCNEFLKYLYLINTNSWTQFALSTVTEQLWFAMTKMLVSCRTGMNEANIAELEALRALCQDCWHLGESRRELGNGNGLPSFTFEKAGVAKSGSTRFCLGLLVIKVSWKSKQLQMIFSVRQVLSLRLPSKR